MNKCVIQILDEVNIKIRGVDEHVLNELESMFAVFAKGYRFQARYKLKIWDGKIKFFKVNKATLAGHCYVKLLPAIITHLRKRKYGISMQDQRSTMDLTIAPIDENYLRDKGFDITLGEHQVRGVNALLAESGGIFEGGTGAGKAQPLYSKILTPDGWKLMGDMQVGDNVVDPTTGTPVKVSGIFPQGKKAIHEITFHDGSTARACDEHLWKVKIPIKYGKTAREEKVVNTQTIIDFMERKDQGDYTPRHISIQTTKPVEQPEIELPFDPYCLGMLIGDGHLSGTPQFSSADIQLVEILREHVSDLGLGVTHSSDYDYYISKIENKKNQHIKNKLSEILKHLKLWDTRSNNKFLPADYMNGSIDQRLSLLQGLMDTDGTVDQKGSCSFSTSSKQLALDVQNLCWSLGMVCSINNKPTDHLMNYNLSIGCESPIDLFRLTRKKERCKTEWNGIRSGLDRRVTGVNFIGYEDAQCIMVDSPTHLYITDDYVVTHNTLMTSVLCSLYEENLGFKCIVIVPTSDLITQTHKELVEYGVDCGQYSGDIKDINHTHLVSTWQSLQNNKGLIGQYQTVIVDECHGVTGQSLQDILNDHGANCTIRLGLTGTLPEEEIDLMAVRITLGEVVERVEASELIANGWLAELKLFCYELVEDMRNEYHEFCEKFPDKASELTYKEFKKTFTKDFQVEKKYLQKKEPRLKFLSKLITAPKGNTLVLVPNVEFGRKISKLIPGSVFFHGKDSKKIRQELYASFDDNDDIIAITTFQLASTGLNIKRIFNLFLVDGGKSFVQIIQSIGRGLRKASDKDKIRVYDVHSDLTFSKRHATTRKKHYTKKSYAYKHKKIEYEGLAA